MYPLEAFLYLLILLLQFSGLFLIGLLVLWSGAVPHLTKPLGNLSNGQTRGLTFHLRAELWAKNEEGRAGKKQNKKKLGYHLHDITGFIVVSLQHESYAPHSDLFWSQKETLLLQEAKNPQKH